MVRLVGDSNLDSEFPDILCQPSLSVPQISITKYYGSANSLNAMQSEVYWKIDRRCRLPSKI
jgi:hypothetical protein